MTDEAFIRQSLFVKLGDELQPTSIFVYKPALAERGLYASIVRFAHAEKYNAKIKGADEFNTVECAISYVSSICRNSTDPEFFWTERESCFVQEDQSPRELR